MFGPAIDFVKGSQPFHSIHEDEEGNRWSLLTDNLKFTIAYGDEVAGGTRIS